jgi:hypothetical protein
MRKTLRSMVLTSVLIVSGCSTSTSEVEIQTSDGPVVGVDAGVNAGVDAWLDNPAADVAGDTSDLAAPSRPETSGDLGVAQDTMDAAMSGRDAPQSAADGLADTLDAPGGGGGNDARGDSGVGRDSAGSADCNAENPPMNDPMNCGACGLKCATGERCGAGHCCPIGSAWCATDGGFACVDVTYDSENCGSCGSACKTAGKECCGGLCVATTSYSSDPKNCGVCRNVCDDPGDFSDACLFLGNCKKASCGKSATGAITCNPQETSACAVCPVGCCKGTVCMPGTSTSACGYDGAPCQTCGQGELCMGGSCECMDFLCGL